VTFHHKLGNRLPILTTISCCHTHIVVYTEVDAKCDKLAKVVGRTSTVASTVNLKCLQTSTTCRPRDARIHLGRTCDDRRVTANFSRSTVWNQWNKQMQCEKVKGQKLWVRKWVKFHWFYATFELRLVPDCVNAFCFIASTILQRQTHHSHRLRDERLLRWVIINKLVRTHLCQLVYIGQQWRNNRPISMPVDYCRHLVGKTPRSVCRCESTRPRVRGPRLALCHHPNTNTATWVSPEAGNPYN